AHCDSGARAGLDDGRIGGRGRGGGIAARQGRNWQGPPREGLAFRERTIDGCSISNFLCPLGQCNNAVKKPREFTIYATDIRLAKSIPSQTWFHVGGIVGGDCHHRHSDRAIAAGRSSGARGGAAFVVHEQLEAAWLGPSELRIGAKALSAGANWLRRRNDQ